jgi:hypothetical protein
MTMRDPTVSRNRGRHRETDQIHEPRIDRPVAPLVWPGRYRVATTTVGTADVSTGRPPI